MKEARAVNTTIRKLVSLILSGLGRHLEDLAGYGLSAERSMVQRLVHLPSDFQANVSVTATM